MLCFIIAPPPRANNILIGFLNKDALWYYMNMSFCNNK